MIGRAGAVVLAALGALGLSGSSPPATLEDVAAISRPHRKSRVGAETPKRHTTKARGNRCAFCGTGGHARTEKHRR